MALFSDDFERADGPIADVDHPWIEVIPDNGQYNWTERLCTIDTGAAIGVEAFDAGDPTNDQAFGAMWDQEFTGTVSIEICVEQLNVDSSPDATLAMDGQIRLFAMANKVDNAKVEMWVDNPGFDFGNMYVDPYNVIADGNYGDDDFYNTITPFGPTSPTPTFCTKLEVLGDGTVNGYFDFGTGGATTLISTGTLTDPITSGYLGFRGFWFGGGSGGGVDSTSPRILWVNLSGDLVEEGPDDACVPDEFDDPFDDLTNWQSAPDYVRDGDTQVDFTIDTGAAVVVEAYDTGTGGLGWRSGSMQRVDPQPGDMQVAEAVLDNVWQLHDPDGDSTDHNMRTAVYLLTSATPTDGTPATGTYYAGVFEFLTGDGFPQHPRLVVTGQTYVDGAFTGTDPPEATVVIDPPDLTLPITLRSESTAMGHRILSVNGVVVAEYDTPPITSGDFQALKMHWDTQFEYPTDGSITSPRVLSFHVETCGEATFGDPGSGEGGTGTGAGSGGDGGTPVIRPPLLTPIGLGCPYSYEVYLMDRSGTEKIRRFETWGSLNYNRVLDDVSQASIALSAGLGNFDCCSDIAGVVPWAFEISIYRNGDRQWTGPITNVRRDSSGAVTISARDKMAWLMKRRMRQTASFNADASDVFNYIVAHAMEPDNVPGLFAAATPTGIGVQRDFVAEQLDKAYDAVQEISRTAIDYTMIREVLVAGNFDVPTQPIASITDAHVLLEPGFEYDGMQQANEWAVGGSGGGNRGFAVTGIFGEADTTFGLLQDTVVESTIRDAASAEANARTRWELTHQSVLVGTELTLTEFAPVTFDTLVPGAVVHMLLTDPCVPLVGSYRLQSVDVTVDVSDSGLDEKVVASIQPVGFEVLA